MTARTPLGRQTCCARCGQDIEYQGRGKWADRGNGRTCLPYLDRKKGEIVQPKGKHVPANP